MGIAIVTGLSLHTASPAAPMSSSASRGRSSPETCYKPRTPRVLLFFKAMAVSGFPRTDKGPPQKLTQLFVSLLYFVIGNKSAFS